MAVKYLSHLETLNINMQGYELQNAVIHTLTNNTRPINPNVGQVMYNTDNQTLELWDGVNWSSVSGDITSITITTGVGLQGGVVGVTGAVTGSISLNHLGLEDLVDPNEDSIFYWNNLTKKSEFLDIGDGLIINSGVLSNTIINNDQLINGSGYITASSSDTLTNKSGNISQWTNDVGYITDGNTNWNNTYGFITGINWDEITGNQLDINLSGFNNDSGFTTFDGDYNSLSNLPTIPTNNNQLINGAGYITTGNDGWVNTYGFITGVNWDEIGGLQSDINLSGFTNDVGFVSGDEFDSSGTYLNLRAQATTKGDVGLGNVENISLSTYTGNGGSLDNQYIINSEGYITGINWDGIGGTQSDINLSGFTNDIGFSTFDGDYNSLTNIPTYTQGSIIFADSDGSLTENNSQLYWDNVNNRLGIGTKNPTEKLEIIGNLNLYDPNNNSKITFRNIPYSNYIKSDGYATHFGIRGNLGNGNVIFENNLDTQQLILIQPTTIGWNLNTTKPLGVNGLFSIDNILSIYNKQSVGIGISNPTEKLDVNGNIKADGILKLYDITDTQKISLNPDGNSYINVGNVGIGTDNPNSSNKLHIKGSTRTALFESNTLVSIVKLVNSSTGYQVYGGLDLVVNSTSESSINSNGIPLTFNTSNTIGVQPIERMRITSDGNVGIGTTNPNSRFTIVGNFSGQSVFRIESPFTNTFSFHQYTGYTSFRDLTLSSNRIVFFDSSKMNIPPFLGVGLVGSNQPQKQFDLLGEARFQSYGQGNIIGTESTFASFTSNGDIVESELITTDGTDISFLNNLYLTNGGYIYGDTTTPYLRLNTTIGSVLGYGTSYLINGGSLQFASSTGTHFRINSNGGGYITNGNLGVNTSTPSEKLDVNGNIKADGILKLFDITNTQTISLNPDSNSYINGGNVGIGTTSPTQKLDVVGNIASQGIYVDRTHEYGGMSNPFARFGLHTLHGDANNVTLQKINNDNKYEFATEVGYLRLRNIVTNKNLTISVSDQSVNAGSGILNLGVMQHRAAHNNYGNYISITNGINSTGTNGIVSVNADFRVVDYVTSSPIENAKIGNDGSAYFNGNVGIGTTSPTERLDVRGVIVAGDTTATTGATSFKQFYTTTGNYLTTIGSEYSSGGFVFGYGVEPKKSSLGVTSTTNVNIFRSKLQLNGDKLVLSFASRQNTPIGDDITDFEDSFIFTNGTFRYDGILQLYDITDTQKIELNPDGDSYINSGNLGIGTSSPSSKLDVYGTISLNGFDALRFDTTNQSLYAGHSAGNSTYRSNAFGYLALQNNTGINSNGFGNFSLENNTGVNSNGFGYFSLRYNSGGNSNGFGFYSLRNNTGDSSNGFGYNSLENNTGVNSNGFGNFSLENNTGVNSNGFGYLALQNNTGDSSNGFGYYTLRNNSGLNNSAFGHQSAYSVNVLTGINNTFLGANSTYGTSSITNSTAVGANVTLTDSNTVVLGNGANVGIGTTTPSEKLDVIGNIKADGILKLYDITDTQTIELNPDGDSYINTKLRVGTTTSNFTETLYINGNGYSTGHWKVGTSTTYVGGITNENGVLTIISDATRDIQFKHSNYSTPTIFLEGQTQNVGIGTTSPTDTLHLYDAEAKINFQSSYGRTSSIQQGGGYFSILADNVNGVAINYGASNRGKLTLFNNTTDAIRLDANGTTYLNGGNVGIGTTSPTERLDVVGNIKSSGYITGKRCGAAGYLASPVNITVTTANTYYPIGVFTVPVAADFIVGTTYPNGLKYTGTIAQTFHITWNATVESTSNNVSSIIDIEKNGVSIPMAKMGTYAKTGGEIYNLSGQCVVDLDTNDEVRFVVTADNNGEVLTFDYFAASIKEFFD